MRKKKTADYSITRTANGYILETPERVYGYESPDTDTEMETALYGLLWEIIEHEHPYSDHSDRNIRIVAEWKEIANEKGVDA